MRNTVIAAAALLLTGAAAGAQQVSPPLGTGGTMDLGVQFTDVSGDPYRYQRFRDFDDGLFVQSLRLDRQEDGWLFTGGGERIGRSDQRFYAEFTSAAKLRIGFVWDQIPLLVSGDTRTLYRTESPGVLRIDPETRGAIEAGRATLAQFAPGARLLPIDSHRHVAAFDLIYNAAPEVDVTMSVRQTRREGLMPWGAPFGFNNDVEVAAPIDTRTTDVNAGLEWGNQRGMLRVAYDGSWFVNDIPTLIWDNPLKLTDFTSPSSYVNGLGGSQGQAALFPSNDLQGVTAAGSVKLPASSRFTANIRVGASRQNEPLLPVTINSAVPLVELPRPTAQAEARTLAMNYTFSSRPSPFLWLNARYRYYDYDNRTPVFQAPLSVTFDQAAHPGEPSEPHGVRRGTVDLDAAFSPTSLVSIKVGYGRDDAERTFRIYEKTTEDVFRASIDSISLGLLTLRAIYEHGERRGSGFDPELLAEVGERPEMRHFDVADRDRDRVTALVQVTPHKAVGFSASYGTGRDDYLNSGFGLRNNENRIYTVAGDVSAGTVMDASVSYTKERFTAVQNSRFISPPNVGQEFDPRRDWSTDSEDDTDTVSAWIDVRKLLPRTEVSLGYDYSRSNATYVYRLPANTTLAAPVQLPAVRNELRSATADLRVALSRRVKIGLLYWYDDYVVDDFTLDAATINRIDLPGTLLLGYVFRDYTANAAAVRIIWAF